MGVPDWMIAEILGHSQVVITRRHSPNVRLPERFDLDGGSLTVRVCPYRAAVRVA